MGESQTNYSEYASRLALQNQQLARFARLGNEYRTAKSEHVHTRCVVCGLSLPSPNLPPVISANAACDPAFSFFSSLAFSPCNNTLTCVRIVIHSLYFRWYANTLLIHSSYIDSYIGLKREERERRTSYKVYIGHHELSDRKTGHLFDNTFFHLILVPDLPDKFHRTNFTIRA